ncbi:MAG: NAD-dependent epimerase/dehydratase family protein [Proteobacteria bacterium]|nr:NAD-dependent epimerase/dehydratase family protein [Pseudomonadota bacterium]
MRLLVLGGTRFLGRHVVEDALRRGHAVTTFSRGRTVTPWPDRVLALVGDRDPRVAPGLSALAGAGTRGFDAVVDCSGYVPRVVDASASLLAQGVRRYVFVSSVSVYADLSRAGADESAPVATLADPATEDILPHYGALKAACEAAVSRVYGGRTTIVRPGLIVGPFDATDRFGYWVARFVHPELLGDRDARAVVPAPPERALQFVDVRDLAAFLVELVERDVGGTFNAASPQGRFTMGELIATLVDVAGAAAPAPVWLDEARLAAAGVEPWVGLPLWLPAAEPDHAGMMVVNCARAEAAGLATRELADTVIATAGWLAARDNAGAWRHVLGAALERELASA